MSTYLHWWRKFAPFSIPVPAAESPFDVQTNQARRSMFLRVLNRAVLGMAGVAFIAVFAFPTIREAAAVLFLMSVGVFSVVRFLNMRGHVQAAAVVFSVMTDVGSLAVFATLAHQQGLAQALLTEAPSLMMMGLAVLFAGALVSSRAAFTLTVVNSAILIGLVAASGSDDPRLSIHLFWWIIAITVWLYERTMAGIFAQLSAARADLERKVDERTIQLSRALEQMEAVMNNSSDVIVLADAKGNIVKTNPAFDALLGAQIDLAIENLLRVIPSDDDVADYADALLRVLYEAIPQRIEAKIALQDGSLLDADVVLAPIRVPDCEDCAGVILSLRDITHLKRMDRQNMQFVVNAAHDLSNPLTVLKTRLYLLRHAPDQLEKHLAILDQQAARMERLIFDLRTLAALDRGVMGVSMAPVELNVLIESIIESHRPVAEQKNLAITFEAEPNLPALVADSHYCERVFANLIANAINYTPSGGQIALATRRDSGHVVATVRDTGMGITAKDLPHIFERFYRSDSAKKADANGTGLGLAIVKEMVEIHNGTIAVQSEADHGSTFTVKLPLKSE